MKTLLCAGALLVLSVAVWSCDPDCCGKQFGDLVGDPENCANYYFCTGDCVYSPDPLPCGDGQEFDNDNHACTDAGAPHECASCGAAGLNCNITCPTNFTNSVEFVADIDCSQYYGCLSSGSVVGPYKCSADRPYFDSSTGMCVETDEHCCSRICEPYCPSADMVVPDVHDCHGFYLCTEADTVPDETFHLTCPEGTNFNLQLNKCTSDANCVVICDNPAGTAK